VFIFLLLTSFCFAQLTGRYANEHLGIAFDIPTGWKGQIQDDMILLGSDTKPGLIIITPHQYDKAQLMAEAKAGLNEEGGTSLRLEGPLASLSKNAVGGTFTGTLEWEEVKAYVLGIPNEEGSGMLIMAATSPAQYSSEYESICKSLLKSTVFSKVDHDNELQEWREYLANSSLIYMDSYSSSSYVDGGISGGYSTEHRIELCGAGYYNRSGSSSHTIGGDGVSGYGSSSSGGEGNWMVLVNGAGEFILQLESYGGDVTSYVLSYEENKLYLDGTRYFVASEGEYAPDC